MAERGRKLTKASITNLRRTMSDVEQLKARIRLGSERSSETRRAAAHYIVETPSGGIPAATGSPPNPGSAECTIFWRNGDPKEVSTTNRTVTVYNYTSTLIPGTTLVMVHRDGWGDLWAVPSDSSCASLEDLEPGTYRAICGATIAPGESGPIEVTKCDSTKVDITAVNHSNCTYYLGDKILLHVTPCCTAFISGCAGDAPAVCDVFVSVCIGGVRQILAANGGTHTFDVASCCGCSGATLEITLSCSTGPDTITANWNYDCGATSDSGSVDLSSLFNLSSDVLMIDQISVAGCYFADSFSNYIVDCDACDENPCSTCKTYTITSSGPTGSGIQNIVFTPTTVDTGEILNISFEMVGVSLSAELVTARIEMGSGIADILTTSPSPLASSTEPGLDCDGTPATTLQWSPVSLAFGATQSYSATFRMQLPAAMVSSPISISIQRLASSGNTTASYSAAFVDCT